MSIEAEDADSDTKIVDLLEEIVLQLKIANAYQAIYSGEEITENDIEGS